MPLLRKVCFIRALLLLTVFEQVSGFLDVSLVAEPSPVRLLSTARLVCTFHGHDDLKLQYIAWTKIDFDGQRTFVYEHTSHCVSGPIQKSYNDLQNRSVLHVVEPLDASGYMPGPSAEHQPSDWRERDVLRRVSLEIHKNGKNGAFIHSTGAESLHGLTEPRVGEGTATLFINDVWFLDEAKYECLVKVQGEPAVSDVTSLYIVGKSYISFLPLGLAFTQWCSLLGSSGNIDDCHSSEIFQSFLMFQQSPQARWAPTMSMTT